MNDDDLLALYNGFAQSMRENGLGWVVDQGEEQLALLPQRQTQNTRLPSDRYVPFERVQLLLRAAEFVIVETASMEQQILNYTTRQDRIIRFSPRFYSSRNYKMLSGEPSLEIQDGLQRDSINLRELLDQQSSHQTIADTFRQTLEQIRREIGNA